MKDMAGLEEKLLEIKKDIDERVKNKAKMEGQLESIMVRIKELCSCESIDEAMEELEKQGKILNKKEVEFEKAVNNLVAKYDKLVG